MDESALELPPPNRTRAFGIALVVVVDLAMAGVGVWLMWRHFTARPVVVAAVRPAAPAPAPDAGRKAKAPGVRPTRRPTRPTVVAAAPAKPAAATSGNPAPDAAPAAAANPEIDAAAEMPPSDVENLTEAVRQVVNDHREAIGECYRRAAKWGPIEGGVEIHLTISPTGEPADVRVVENHTSSEELGVCVAALMSTWRYPSPGDLPLELVWPFRFAAAR